MLVIIMVPPRAPPALYPTYKMVTTPKDISDQLKALTISSSQVKTTGEVGKEIGRGAYGRVFTVKYCGLICAAKA